MKCRAGLALLAVVVLANDARAATSEAPAWLSDAAAAQVPGYPAKVSSVTLLDEETVTVEPDGRRTIHERGAVKILQQTRRSHAAFRT